MVGYPYWNIIRVFPKDHKRSPREQGKIVCKGRDDYYGRRIAVNT